MLRQKLIALLKECCWLLEKTVEGPRELRQMQEQVARKIAELEGGKQVQANFEVSEGKKVA
ncbi:Uncharacterized [Moorella glycerini]|uniref:Uncharacterized protein n=1 Tax=Neomoorella stamsii TaxID=1266720 RepID=A0A9X7P5N0_9FIRM|nr:MULTISPECIES: hypothetical protein [Moorella]PRR71770.1 hypothetical protein MOST_23380 [Moorella stamsii]CEP67187.1 Uncharacterized [Moorella glycerini]